ncbi:MAG: hypothetical protein LBH77_08535 [Tannerella sp.]|nr:hypothetical protein [Tannerella sp.]
MNDEDHFFLAPGIHDMSWDEFSAQFSFSQKRRDLLIGLKKTIEILKQVNCPVIYIDGSFVSQKNNPGDWDACIDCSTQVVTALFKVFPFADIDEQIRIYGGELYHARTEADEYGTIFLDFFQQIKTDSAKKKGIVRINLEEK